MITCESWGDYRLYTMRSDTVTAQFTDVGAAIVSLKIKGRESVIGHRTAEEYLALGGCLGATVGRYANRIRGAAFTLNGKTYSLTANEGRNTLHGGTDGLPHHKRRWESTIDGEALRFTLVSPDGDNGFPGAVTATVSYTLLPDGLRVDYEAESDADTHYAPTNHSYFDLSGRGNCLEATLQLNADRYLAIDAEKLPLAAEPVQGTRFDFLAPRKVAEDYDHAFVLSGSPACTLTDGGRTMRIFTDFPAIQVYTGGGLGADHKPREALALEPEFYPDSPNHPEFPSTVLRKGERFHKYIEYRFDENEK